ncbi:MAG: hypothetical protein R3B09_08585 [Nannocystaceae bacterium]
MGPVFKDLFIRTFTASLGGASVALGCAATSSTGEPSPHAATTPSPGEGAGAGADRAGASAGAGNAGAGASGEGVDAAAQDGPEIAVCVEPPEAPALDYNLAAKGARFHVDVAHARGIWAPAGPVKMPFHHASAIVWTNADAHPELAAIDRRLRFTIEIVDVHIEHDPARSTWFATYTARIDRVCAPPAPG